MTFRCFESAAMVVDTVKADNGFALALLLQYDGI